MMAHYKHLSCHRQVNRLKIECELRLILSCHPWQLFMHQVGGVHSHWWNFHLTLLVKVPQTHFGPLYLDNSLCDGLMYSSLFINRTFSGMSGSRQSHWINSSMLTSCGSIGAPVSWPWTVVGKRAARSHPCGLLNSTFTQHGGRGPR